MPTVKGGKPQPTVVRVKPVTAHIGPLGFRRYASQFLDAVQGLRKSAEFSPVPYYLYCRSIELALKAFLLGKQVPVKDLSRKLGHDLNAILIRARNLGLEELVPVSSLQEAELGKANEYYKAKGFEYFRVYEAVVGYPGLPDLEVLDQLASALVDGLGKFCLEVT